MVQNRKFELWARSPSDIKLLQFFYSMKQLHLLSIFSGSPKTFRNAVVVWTLTEKQWLLILRIKQWKSLLASFCWKTINKMYFQILLKLSNSIDQLITYFDAHWCQCLSSHYHMLLTCTVLTYVLWPGSERNYSRLTFHGVDVTGNRLADEVCNRYFPVLTIFAALVHKIWCLLFVVICWKLSQLEIKQVCTSFRW